MGTRRRQLEKPLQQLDAVRRERNLPIDGQLFAEIGHESDESDDEPAMRPTTCTSSAPDGEASSHAPGRIGT